MYPKRYLDDYRTFSRTNRVFVAMPIKPAFEKRWERVFSPAIKKVGLKPWRADSRSSGDSIQTEILKEIGQAQLILVDISTDNLNRRNENVMYELGIAHAARLPEEVIIVRSDKGPLPFDFTQIRVKQFNPTIISKAQAVIYTLLNDALLEIDYTKDLLVDRTIQSLDEDALHVMLQEYTVANKDINAPLRQFHPGPITYGHLKNPEFRAALHRLHTLGVVAIDAYEHKKPARYIWTDLGRAIIKKLMPDTP